MSYVLYVTNILRQRAVTLLFSLPQSGPNPYWAMNSLFFSLLGPQCLLSCQPILQPSVLVP